MGRKAFGIRQFDGSRRPLSFGPFVDREQAGDLQEIADAQWGMEPGAASGGHDVAGTGDIVAQGFRSVFAHEDPSGMAYPVHQRPGIRHQQAQVLGRVVVRQPDRLVQVRDEHDPPVPFQRRTDCVRPVQFGQLFFHGVLNRQGQRG